MRLSDAVMLGQGLIEFNAMHYLDHGCGCLIGAGFAAATGRDDAMFDEMVAKWPWLMLELDTPEMLINGAMRAYKPRQHAYSIISQLALQMQWGANTLEQAVDWIRLVEPAEPEVSPETVQEPSLVEVA